MTDEELMCEAIRLAKKASLDGEVPVGAVVARNGEIVSTGRNRRESGKNALYHAEIEAIDGACKALGGWQLWACELFVTLEPCPMCAGAIVNAHMKRVVFGAFDPKNGACGSVTDLLSLPGSFHPQCSGGLMQEECASLLTEFFRNLRKNKMEKIASFTVDHTKLQRGMYISRIDGDIVTYDIRMRRPNVEEPMATGALHTIEHLFATYVRNSAEKDHIIYFGPMGCRTGCYFLTRGLPHETALRLTKEAFAFIRDFSGEIPGAKEEECGNYRDHDLAGAKKEAADQSEVLKDWTAEKMNY